MTEMIKSPNAPVETQEGGNSPAHHRFITRDRIASETMHRCVVQMTLTMEQDAKCQLLDSISQFKDEGGCILKSLPGSNDYRLLRVLDQYDSAEMNRFTNLTMKISKQPPSIETWKLEFSTSNLFSLPTSSCYTLTLKLPPNNVSKAFQAFCQELDEQCGDFLSLLIASESRKSDTQGVYHCIFFANSSRNWESFSSSKMFKNMKSTLQEIANSTRNFPFDQFDLIYLWDSEGVELTKTATTPRLNTLEQMSSDAQQKEVVSLDIPEDSEYSRFTRFLEERYAAIMTRKTEFIECKTTGTCSTLVEASRAGLNFGAVRDKKRGGIVFRDWVTGDVEKVIVRGEFSEWEDCEMELESETIFGYHTWSYYVPDIDGVSPVKEGTKYQFKFIKDGHSEYRVPAYARHVNSDDSTGNMDGRILTMDYSELHTAKRPLPFTSEVPLVYECHIGTSTGSNEHIGTFAEFKDIVLPRVVEMGYNTICFMGISQHTSYSTFGWHVSSHYAPDLAFGTPKDLHLLINECHKYGIRCWISVVHSHAAPGTGGLRDYMKWGQEGYCPNGGLETSIKRFDAYKFALDRHEVIRYLLGSIVMWAEEYKMDGIRIENIHTLLFHHQGIGYDFGMMSLDKHFDHEADLSSHVYLALAANLCRDLGITATATTECESPLLTAPLRNGGLGFDYIFSTAANKMIQDCVKMHHGFNVRQLAKIAQLQTFTGNKTILSASNWDNAIYARRPLKIALLSWETLYTHPVGGVAPHVTELAAGLQRLGHEVHIFTRSTTQAANHSIHHGVHLHECPMQLNSDFVQEIRNMCSSLSSHLLQTESYMNDAFDIVHAHDWLAGPGLEGLKELGRTTVQTMHSTEYGRCGNQNFEGQSKTVRQIEERACHLADRVICVSGVFADEVKMCYSVHPEKIRVVYNGINATNWDGFEDGAEIKARYGISPMQPMLLFVGRMVIQKGPDLMIDALHEIVAARNDVVLVMVGDGHMLDELRHKTDAMGLGGNVKWLGKKGGAELKSLFKACDAVLVPSRNEPFGIVVLEAWACYKPVVATTCGGPRDFVSHDVDGYLVDPVPSSVAWGVKQILSNFEHTRWMGSRGRVKAAFNFTWDKIAHETRDVYLELINRQDAPYGIAPVKGHNGEHTLIAQLIGPLITCRMSVFDDCAEVQRGIDIYNMIRLFTAMSSAYGHMTFIGTEFGNPDIIDLPRPGNHFSKDRARIPWDLSLATHLKFKFMGFFVSVINKMIKKMPNKSVDIINVDESRHTIVCTKGDLICVYNFSPESFDSFDIGHPFGLTPLKYVLSSAETRFSGRRDVDTEHFSITPISMESGQLYMNQPSKLSIQLPSYSVVVLGTPAFNMDAIEEETDQWVAKIAEATVNSRLEASAKSDEIPNGPLRERV